MYLLRVSSGSETISKRKPVTKLKFSPSGHKINCMNRSPTECKNYWWLNRGNSILSETIKNVVKPIISLLVFIDNVNSLTNWVMYEWQLYENTSVRMYITTCLRGTLVFYENSWHLSGYLTWFSRAEEIVSNTSRELFINTWELVLLTHSQTWLLCLLFFHSIISIDERTRVLIHFLQQGGKTKREYCIKSVRKYRRQKNFTSQYLNEVKYQVG